MISVEPAMIPTLPYWNHLNKLIFKLFLKKAKGSPGKKKEFCWDIPGMEDSFIRMHGKPFYSSLELC